RLGRDERRRSAGREHRPRHVEQFDVPALDPRGHDSRDGAPHPPGPDDLGLGRRADGRRRTAVRDQSSDDRSAPAPPVIRIVIPYAGAGGKTRLGVGREELSLALPGDVLAAANSVGRTWIVSPEPIEGATWILDPGGGQ